MAKPIAPEGPITFEVAPPKVSLGKVLRRLGGLASDPLLGRIDTAIKEEDWQATVAFLHLLREHILEAHGVTGRAISRINSKLHSPLFPELEQHADEVDLHDH
jgi:hypothetical protein